MSACSSLISLQSPVSFNLSIALSCVSHKHTYMYTEFSVFFISVSRIVNLDVSEG